MQVVDAVVVERELVLLPVEGEPALADTVRAAAHRRAKIVFIHLVARYTSAPLYVVSIGVIAVCVCLLLSDGSISTIWKFFIVAENIPVDVYKRHVPWVSHTYCSG